MALGLLSLLGPPRCAGCGRQAGPLCDLCFTSLPPAPVGAVPTPGADRTLARALVLGLKARGQRDCAAPLAAGMIATARRAGLAAEVATWVPARSSDVRRRGFDHARVLAEAVARSLGLPRAGLLLRTDQRRDQVGLSAPARRRNLEGAFVARPSPARRVVLIDDLVTTGSTATECAAALRAGGAAGIEVLLACRA